MRLIGTNTENTGQWNERNIHLVVAVRNDDGSESYHYGVGYSSISEIDETSYRSYYVYKLESGENVSYPYNDMNWIRYIVLQTPIVKPIIRIEPFNFGKHRLTTRIAHGLALSTTTDDLKEEEKEDITMYSYNGISGKFMKLILPNKSFGEMCVVVKGILFPTIVTQKFIDYHNKGGFKAIQVIGNWRSGTPTKVQVLDPDWFPNASTTEYIYGAFVTRYEELKNVNLSHPIDIVDYSFLTQSEMEVL